MRISSIEIVSPTLSDEYTDSVLPRDNKCIAQYFRAIRREKVASKMTFKSNKKFSHFRIALHSK